VACPLLEPSSSSKRPARAQAAVALDSAYNALLEHALSPTLVPSPVACLPASRCRVREQVAGRWTARQTTRWSAVSVAWPPLDGWMGGAPS